MFSGPEIAVAFESLGVTDVVWLPDTTLGGWEAEFERRSALRLIRVCREGEAWAIAAGLLIGDRRPMVVMQSTGLFESGDALRNAVYDLGLPLWGWIGDRSRLLPQSSDSARRFAEPILRAWELDYLFVRRHEQLAAATEHFRRAAAAGRSAFVLMAEGKG